MQFWYQPQYSILHQNYNYLSCSLQVSFRVLYLPRSGNDGDGLQIAISSDDWCRRNVQNSGDRFNVKAVFISKNMLFI